MRFKTLRQLFIFNELYSGEERVLLYWSDWSPKQGNSVRVDTICQKLPSFYSSCFINTHQRGFAVILEDKMKPKFIAQLFTQ